MQLLRKFICLIKGHIVQSLTCDEYGFGIDCLRCGEVIPKNPPVITKWFEAESGHSEHCVNCSGGDIDAILNGTGAVYTDKCFDAFHDHLWDYYWTNISDNGMGHELIPLKFFEYFYDMKKLEKNDLVSEIRKESWQERIDVYIDWGKSTEYDPNAAEKFK